MQPESAADLDDLRGDLERLRRLLTLAGDGKRDAALSDAGQRLGVAAERAGALEAVRKLFGGMGSLNDIFFHESNGNVPRGYGADDANRELSLLLNNIFRGASLFGASAEERAEWARLERESQLPPRVLNAFRGRT